MILLDTNIILEILLEQEKHKQVEEFLKNFSANQIFMTDFSIHSIGIVLIKTNKREVLNNFIDSFASKINNISLGLAQLKMVPELVEKFGLDFDDAYQYLATKFYGLQLVSFDKDFDKTDIERFKI